MTAKSLLTALLPLVSDLSRELPERERYRRLLEAMRALLPCDAAALLRLDGEWLVPLAVDGLSPDTLGRRFKVSEHPRFAVLLGSPGPTRFDSDSELPDPYDGLVDGLLKEGQDIMESTEPGPVRDAGIIAACQKVEHYEIATYGTIVAFAKTLGMDDVASLLHITLEEEKAADITLTEAAYNTINFDAAEADDDME